MLDTLKSSINNVLLWMVGGVASIAGAFSGISSHASSIPVVGGALANLFTGVQSLFNDLGYNIAHFSSYLNDTLDVIAGWLDQVADLASDVNQWIAQGISEISFDLAALKDIVVVWITEQLGWALSGLEELQFEFITWISAEAAETWFALGGLLDYVHGWITDQLTWAYAAARMAMEEVTNLWDRIADLPGLIKSEILQLIAPVYNLVEFFFQDISDFFSDPADYFDKKVEQLGSPFAERLWGVVEKILERIW